MAPPGPPLSSPPPPIPPLGRLPGLDLLRGIAALCVVGLHLEWLYGLQPRLFAQGYLAVDLFFMLSGYVMARTYEPRFARGLGSIAFLLARYRRLWPVMAIGSMVGLPKLFLESSDAADFGMAAGLNLLLLPVVTKALAFPLNIPAWSIHFELAVNLLHGLVLWKFGLRWLLALGVAALPLVAWAGMSHGTLDFGAHAQDYFPALARAILSYAIGIVLWRWWRDEPGLCVPPAFAFVAMPAIFICTGLLGIRDWRIDLAFIVLACPLLLAGGLRYRRTEGMVPLAATALGALSFPLYAIHVPVIEATRMLPGFNWITAGIAALAAGIALTLATEGVTRWRRRHRRATA